MNFLLFLKLHILEINILKGMVVKKLLLYFLLCEFFTINPDDWAVEVIVAIQRTVLMLFWLVVRGAGEIAHKWPQSSTDIAAAVTAACGEGFCLYDFPHIGIISD